MLGLILFVIVIPLALIFSYFWAVIIYRLFGADSKKDKIIRVIIYIAVAFLVFGGWGVLMDICIFLWIRDFKKKASYYHAKHLLGKVAFGLSIPVFAFSAWQLELPQKIIINLINDKIEIFDNNYTVLENNNKSNIVSKFENDGYLPQISLFEIYFRTREIYIYDDINKTINERKIAEIKTPFIAESTLMCFLRNIETGGKCTGFTNGSKYKVNGKKFTLNELLKQYQKGEKQ